MSVLQVERRGATADDEPFERAVFGADWEPKLAAVGWPADAIDHFVRQQFDARRPQHRAGGAATEIIVVNGEPVGVMTVRRSLDEIQLVDIAVLPAHRGQGVATLMLRALVAEANSTVRAVRLHVAADNPARRLYARLGFDETAHDDGALHIEMVKGAR